MTGTATVREFIEQRSFSRFHFWMLFWTCFIITFDMYDLVVYGAVLPVLIKQWGITPVEAGAIGSYGFFGMMLGAVGFGVLADRFGRKRILLTAVVLFSASTALCGFAPSPTVFSVFRFLAGLGIGGILPTVIATLTDYAPKGRANSYVAIVMSFFHVGGIVAALVAMALIPRLGWQAVYWLAAIPLFFVPFMGRYFPDSPSVLVRRRGPDAALRVLGDLAGRPVAAAEVSFPAPEAKEQRAPIQALFTEGRALGTVMIWIAFFMCLLMLNGLTVWLPQLMVRSGYDLGSSLNFPIWQNIGAIVGTLFFGRLADRLGVKRVLVPMYVGAAISLGLLGFGSGLVLLLALIAVTGATANGAQNLSYAFVAQYYPPFMRSTAIGLASAVGRIGAIFGPIFGGVLLTMNLPISANFLWFGLPGLLAALAFWFVPLKRKADPAESPLSLEEAS